jgi:hypothetical protein
MKLENLLTDLFELNNGKTDFPKIDTLDSKNLLNIKQYLLDCDELKNIKNFDIIEMPYLENEMGEIIETKTFKLTDGVKFGSKCYIQSISISPEIFNPDTIYTPVKDGACITPTMYDPLSFKPKKKICIEFSPEEIQDDLINGESKKKEELIELFKKVLDSPDEYRVKGKRSFMIRGIFDEITINGETHKVEIGNLNLDHNNQKHFMVMYFDNVLNDDNTISIKLDKKYLPINMKGSFIEKFENKKIIAKKELDEFLKSFEA